jgi:hypothetical protein
VETNKDRKQLPLIWNGNPIFPPQLVAVSDDLEPRLTLQGIITMWCNGMLK